jgi:cyclopropane-fatty-acyl-phospholipid synthase
MVIRDAMTIKRLLAQGSIGFGEAYMDERIKIEGNIEDYLRFRHNFKRKKYSLYLAIASFLASRSIPKNRKNQIAQHYDVSNDFFKIILDNKTMSYSCGKYKNNSDSLVMAQENKLKLICEWLKLPQRANILDLGSGWGGLAVYAASNFNWHVKGYTLSRAQLEYCLQLAKEKNLDDLLSFEYFDILNVFPKFKFDGIVMIESIEHLGQKNILPFFEKVKELLKPGSSFVVQSTVRQKIRSVDRWTLKYVFPGGYLPSKEEIVNHARAAGFIVEESINDSQDYVYTMTEWIKNLEANKDKIKMMYGARFYRLWELWMHGTKVSFETGAIGLTRLHFKLPL